MKKILLVAGIVTIVACVLSLMYAGINLFGYYHVLDGSHALYRRLHDTAITFGIIGLVLGLIGTVCLLIRSRIS